MEKNYEYKMSKLLKDKHRQMDQDWQRIPHIYKSIKKNLALSL